MRTISLLIAIMPILAAQVAMIPAKGGAQGAVYIVSRATTAESRALFSARLLRMNATKLYWYENASVVRAQISPTALQALRADKDVVLVLPETPLPEKDHPAQVGAPGEVPPRPAAPRPPEPAPTAPLLPAAAASLPPGCASPMLLPPPGGLSGGPVPPMSAGPMAGPPMGAPPMGTMGIGSMGLGMGAGVGLLDSLAGGVAQRLLNRPPSCKITVARNSARFPAAGGEGLIEINASGACAWQAQASIGWIKILSGSGVSGSGIVSYSVEPTDGRNRSGAIWIATSATGSPIKGRASQVVTQTK